MGSCLGKEKAPLIKPLPGGRPYFNDGNSVLLPSVNIQKRIKI